jgi:DNA-binding response OmpR family regulator
MMRQRTRTADADKNLCRIFCGVGRHAGLPASAPGLAVGGTQRNVPENSCFPSARRLATLARSLSLAGMKKILLVEDDELIAAIYKKKLAGAGFDVSVAEDGLAAVKQMPVMHADLIVLDLLLPKLSGADVLRFIRQNRELKSTRVIVLSNAFLSKLGEQVAALGVDELLAKAAATPDLLIATINKVLERPAKVPAEAEPAVAAAPASPPPAEAEMPSPENVAPPKPSAPAVSPSRPRIQQSFFEQVPTIVKNLQDQCRDFLAAEDPAAQSQRLEGFERKVGFLAHMTGMAGCHRIAQLASAFEALLFELRERPSAINESSRHTITATSGLLVDFLNRTTQPDEQCLSPLKVLVVDDDAVSNRALVFALGRVGMHASSLTDPLKALENLRQNSYDAVLLDLNLPGMDGIALREQMRQMSRHEQTPAILITSYKEFAERARSILGSNDDLIAKPVMPIELAVKVTSHVLKRRSPASAA